LAAASLALLSCVLADAAGPTSRATVIEPAPPPVPPMARVEAKPAPKPAKPSAPPEPLAFDAWLDEFRRDALAAGLRPETLDRELSGLVPDPRVIALDGAQPDRTAVSPLTFADYRAKQLTPSRVERGRRLRSDLSATLSSVEAQFGVPAEILLAIWGKETSYGQVPGGLDVVRSLATLAHEGRRREFFTRELIAALKLIETGAIDREALVGSWAGATGQTQFMPTSYLAHAVDGNGDGLADIWGSRADTLASIAAYFVAHGWRRNEPWAVEVVLPAGFDRERVRNLTPVAECAGLGWRHSRWIPIADWRALGVEPVGALLPADAMLATLIEPDGPGGSAYLTFANYRPIMRYNCSNYYALTVGQLADAIAAGRGPATLLAAGGTRTRAAR
jgi:lytic murein transglycosylase